MSKQVASKLNQDLNHFWNSKDVVLAHWNLGYGSFEDKFWKLNAILIDKAKVNPRTYSCLINVYCKVIVTFDHRINNFKGFWSKDQGWY